MMTISIIPRRAARVALAATLGLMLLLVLASVALACDQGPFPCQPIVFSATGRPLEVSFSIPGCPYDPNDAQVAWSTKLTDGVVTIAGPGAPDWLGGPLVTGYVVQLSHAGSWHLIATAQVTARHNPAKCYSGSSDLVASVPGPTSSSAAPSPTPTPTPALSPLPTATPTAVASPTAGGAVTPPPTQGPAPSVSPGSPGGSGSISGAGMGPASTASTGVHAVSGPTPTPAGFGSAKTEEPSGSSQASSLATPRPDPPSEAATEVGAVVVAAPAATSELRAGPEQSRAGSLIGGLLPTALLLIFAVAGSLVLLVRRRLGRG